MDRCQQILRLPRKERLSILIKRRIPFPFESLVFYRAYSISPLYPSPISPSAVSRVSISVPIESSFAPRIGPPPVPWKLDRYLERLKRPGMKVDHYRIEPGIFFSHGSLIELYCSRCVEEEKIIEKGGGRGGVFIRVGSKKRADTIVARKRMIHADRV